MISDSQVLGSLVDAQQVTVPEADLLSGAGQPIVTPTSTPTVNVERLSSAVSSVEKPTEVLSADVALTETTTTTQDAGLYGGNWSVDDQDQTRSVFYFSDLRKVAQFSDTVLWEAAQLKLTDFTCALVFTTENKWGFTIGLSVFSDQARRLAYLANYAHLRLTTKTDSYYDEFTQPEPDHKLALGCDEMGKFSVVVEKLSVRPQGLNAQSRLIKVPFAVIGSWQHDEYGEVSFTQKDFDRMRQNFASKVVGFEPPLFLGHPINTTTVEGHPAEGYLLDIIQEGDVLSGLFETVSDATYAAVALGQFRYSSGEFIRNWRSKVDGESLGTALVGVALTNRPFVPNMPRVKALSADFAPMALTFQFSNPMTQPTENQTTNADAPVQPASETPVVETPSAPALPKVELTASSSADFEQFRTQVLADLKTMKATYTQQLESADQRLTQTLSQLGAAQVKIEALSVQLQAEQEKSRQQEISSKLAELEAFTLPQEVKEQYSEMIRTGALGDQESAVLASLKQLASTRLTEATTQYGTATTTQALNSDQIEDPYAATVQRNRDLIQQREERLRAQLGL